MKPREMVKVTVWGHDGMMKRAIDELHALKVMHIIEHDKGELDIGSPLVGAEEIAGLKVRVSALIQKLGITGEEARPVKEKTQKEIIRQISSLEDDVNRKLSTIRELEEKKAALEKAKDSIGMLDSLNLCTSCLGEYVSISYYIGHVQDHESFKKHVTSKLKAFDLRSSKDAIALFVPKEEDEEAQKLLGTFSFNPSDITALSNPAIMDELKEGKLSEASISRAIEESDKKLAKTVEYRRYLARQYGPDLLGFERYLDIELEKAQAPMRFAKTEHAFIISGWVPKGRAKETALALKKRLKGKAHIEVDEPKEKDDVPVELENSRHVKPFQFFLDLYSLPSYKEIDPTFFIFLSFPVLFGFILGDFGYGITTLLLFLGLKKAMPKFKNFFDILIISSLSSIMFGLLFGEFFGFEEIGGFAIPHVLSRAHQIQLLLYAAIGVGVIHVNWGIIAGFVNEMRSHGLEHAVFAKLSWLVIEIGAALLALSLAGILEIGWIAPAVVILSGIIMLYRGEGLNGLVEIPGIASNILSYARLMAVGLASVELAVVVNGFATGFFASGGLMIVAGILVLIIGHAINIMLGLLGGFLHSLRLEYVEFFTKFFKGGAQKYAPFGSG